MPRVKEVQVDVREQLTKLIKDRAPSIFDREPAPAYAEGALKLFVEQVLELFK